MPALGLDWHERFTVHDEITGADLRWGSTTPSGSTRTSSRRTSSWCDGRSGERVELPADTDHGATAASDADAAAAAVRAAAAERAATARAARRRAATR